MPDLEERFGALARSRPPDLWEDISRREPRFDPGPEPSGRQRVLVIGVALVVAAAGVGFVVRAFTGGVRHEGPPASSYASGISQDARAALLAKAMFLGRADGDPNPTSVQAVLTTRGQVDQVFGDRTGDPSEPVYLVQLTGSFVCEKCSAPFGGASPQAGPSMMFVMSTKLGLTDFGCCGAPKDLSSLGTVVDLLASPSSPSPGVAREASIYAALIKGGDENFGTGWVVDSICSGADHTPKVIDCAPMSSELKAVLLQDLGSRYRLVSDPAGLMKRIFAGSSKGTIHWVGPISGTGASVTVPSSYYCGGVCAGGGTRVVTERNGAWAVTGNVGGTWIS